MQDQEKELLEGYRKLRPEQKSFIMSTLIQAVTDESALKPGNEAVKTVKSENKE